MSDKKARLVIETYISNDGVRTQFAELHHRIVDIVMELDKSKEIKMAVEYNISPAEVELSGIYHHPKLSERQRQVAGMLCQHYSVKRIADALFVSENTVKKHIQNMKKTLEIEASGADFVYQLQQVLDRNK
ncbi:LuxR family transcriptional regulator [Salibacterium salarium]|uniref:LuxR family transcriptional regulator n=1 Tax=Salibacterium salarium TaxID=284579 RepID=A0A428N9H6_9BACI|nr:helix-turn-helix transcriptional regulator [Salibacterium salarium]RSL35033.1 LuxR family transcriptional regulator [Salibacterium salarium]